MTELKRYYYGNCGDTEVFDRERPEKKHGIDQVDALNEQDEVIRRKEHLVKELFKKNKALDIEVKCKDREIKELHERINALQHELYDYRKYLEI